MAGLPMDFPLLLASTAATDVPLAMVTPFILLLALIATMPLSPPRIKHWWEHNYPFVALGLAVAVAAYYVFAVPAGTAMLAHTMHEYVSFIVLIGSLFVVAGGIHLRVKGEATPWENVVLLGIGAVVANLVGTTGASMVLIRPWIRMNKIRVSAYHVVFFIFVVSNVGGSLTPIGDPPLFLGYLSGVPFFWLVGHVWPVWLFTVGLILVAFYAFDRRSFKHAPKRIQEQIVHEHDTFKVEGLLNLALLGVIVLAVFVPEKFFMREILMTAAAVASYRLTAKPIHEQNQFSFGPIKEVAFLFVGIFATMMPALNYLEAHGQEFGFQHPKQYYYAAGALSSVLDNAPTYINFLKLGESSFVAESAAEESAGGGNYDHRAVAVLLREHPEIVVAISLGAVFFGAMTYIGNGPNFMVKSIAHEAGVHCPTFFGYILKYSLPILLPILAVSAWVFL